MATTDSNAIQQSKSVATDSNAKQQSKSVYVENPEELKKIFDQFDANKDGKISLAELAAVLKSMGSAYTDDELRRVMDDLDNDKDGFINLSEFSTLCRSSSDASGEAEIHDAFDLYDQDKNALISSKELHLILNKLGMKYSVDECVRMIQSVDSDGDGNVNFEEFKKMMATSVNCSSAP